MTVFTPYIGRPLERIEDLRFLRGQGRYSDDLRHPGMLHAVIMRSPYAHGRIRAIETSAARRMPGVHAVFTAADVPKKADGGVPEVPMRLVPLPELIPFQQPVIAVDRVRYVGEPVAIVVADSVALAEDAVEAIVLDVEPLLAVVTLDDARRGGSLLVEAAGTNIPTTYTASKGDASLADRAPYRRRETLRVHRHTAVAMEPRAVLAIWDGAKTKLTVQGAAKVPFANRRILAQQMDLTEECVDQIESDVGGGFGQRGEFAPEDYLIPFAAMKLNRPVKWTEDRREHLMNATHAREVEMSIEIACERDGTIVALRAEAWTDMGAYVRTAGAIPVRNVAQFLSGLYRIPNIEVKSSMQMSNKTPIGTYRGPGRFEADFFRERMFDLAAKDLGIDPVEFRRRNLPRPDELPYPLATISPPEKKENLDTGDYAAMLDRVLADFRWNEKRALQGQLAEGRYHGIAAGCFIEGGASGPRENARFAVEADGTISLYIGSASVGQGLETVCLQIAADALEVPIERVRVFHGSTPYLKEGFGSYHSRSVVMGGSAIVDAANNLKAEVRRSAARAFGCKPEDVTIAAGLVASFGERSLHGAAFAGLGAEGTFANNFRHTYSYGAAALHVAVDPKTGHVEVVDCLVAEDIGRVMNPLTANGQVVGAMVQGFGGVFLEELSYDESGQFLSGSFADYLLPLATDYPNLRAIVTGDSPSLENPLGAKGGGEGGVVPIGGLVANAVANALARFGVEPLSLPLSPARVWGMIHSGT